MNPFRAAVEARDFEGAVALLADDVVFQSPVVFQPYRGRDTVAAILFAVSRVFEDFRYEREIGAEGGRDHALVFKARVGEREIHGCDLLHTDERGLIDDLTVMVRPLSAALALRDAMQAQLETAQRELGVEPSPEGALPSRSAGSSTRSAAASPRPSPRPPRSRAGSPPSRGPRGSATAGPPSGR